jgi:hypothetical protein
MAQAESRSITRRALVAGSAAAGVAGAAAFARSDGDRLEPPGPAFGRPEDELRESRGSRGEAGPGFRSTQPGLQAGAADPVYAAIDAHARAYAAYDAQQKAEPDDEVTLEPLIEAEWAAAAALAATVPTTLAGTAAALFYVHDLHARDNTMLFDDWHAYVFIASAATAMNRFLDGRSRA